MQMKRSSAIRHIDRYYFPREIIDRAVRDYIGICQIDITENDQKYSCVFSGNTVPAELAADEFENYLIECMQKRQS